MRYEGGKGGSGVYQAIINLMPPHSVYIEAFLGAGSVLRRKKPAAKTIGIEIDPGVLARWRGDEVPALELVQTDATAFLTNYKFSGSTCHQTLIYLDPPYLFDTRKRKRPIYDYEFGDDGQHINLLTLIRTLPCKAMISGYPSKLYDRFLPEWRTHTFTTTTRGSAPVTECVWMNFRAPLELHDYSYLGTDYIDRQRIKRKRARWRARLESMPSQERHALLATVEELRLQHSRD